MLQPSVLCAFAWRQLHPCVASFPSLIARWCSSLPRFRSVPFHSALSFLRPCALLRLGAASAARTVSVVLRSLRPGGCAGGTTSGGDENIALDDGVLAAERRYFLSAPHLEHLVVSSRRVLAEEEV